VFDAWGGYEKGRHLSWRLDRIRWLGVGTTFTITIPVKQGTKMPAPSELPGDGKA
jgi:hypothetical protein